MCKQGLNINKIAVNLSARQFADANLIQLVENTLAESGIQANQLELEITESMVMKDINKAKQTMKLLDELGVSIAIDDFGTGYSSLAYLKDFPVKTLKIDQSFVRNMHIGSTDSAIITAIITLADKLKLNVVAEGVETKEQYKFLQANGCTELQGFFFSKPLPEIELKKFLQASSYSL